jgi:hypothetical protein
VHFFLYKAFFLWYNIYIKIKKAEKFNMKNTNDKIEFITEMTFDNGIDLAGFGKTEDESIDNALSLFPYTTNIRTYTLSDLASLKTYKLPQHYTASEMA